MAKAILLPLAAALAAIAAPVAAKQATEIDYDGFQALTENVASIRSERLVTLDQFTAMASEDDTLILDARSASAYALGHIAGAVNLPFSDFTDEKLAEVLGTNPNRRILIYCNNNFSDNIAPVMLKKAPLALNIPTFINLIGYGYTNVWELGDTVSIADVEWAGIDEQALLASRPANETAALSQ